MRVWRGDRCVYGGVTNQNLVLGQSLQEGLLWLPTGWHNHVIFMGYLVTLQLLLLWGLTASLSAALVMCPHVEGSFWSKVWQYMGCSPWVSWIAVNCIIHFTWVNLLFFAQCMQVSITLLFQHGPTHSVCSHFVLLPLFSDICTSLHHQ